MLNLSILRAIVRHDKIHTPKMCSLLTILHALYERKGIGLYHGTHCLLTVEILELSLRLFTLVLEGAVWASISGVGACTQLLKSTLLA